MDSITYKVEGNADGQKLILTVYKNNKTEFHGCFHSNYSELAEICYNLDNLKRDLKFPLSSYHGKDRSFYPVYESELGSWKIETDVDKEFLYAYLSLKYKLEIGNVPDPKFYKGWNFIKFIENQTVLLEVFDINDLPEIKKEFVLGYVPEKFKKISWYIPTGEKRAIDLATIDNVGDNLEIDVENKTIALKNCRLLFTTYEIGKYLKDIHGN